jgi:TRAP-type C4-dicarboxylate transport system permease small subunit
VADQPQGRPDDRPDDQPQGRPEDQLAGRRAGAVARGLALAGGGLLLGIAGFVTLSVVLRAATGSGINGDFEVVQTAAAVAAFCLFPLCLATRGNIMVDTFTRHLPPRLTARLDGMWDAGFGILMAVCAARMAVGAADQWRTGTTTVVLGVPTWGAVAACALLLGVLAGVSLRVGVRQLWQRP